MNMDHCWTDTDREKPNYSEKTYPNVTLFTTDLHVNLPKIEKGPPQ